MPEYRDLSQTSAVRNTGSTPVAGSVPIFTGVGNATTPSAGTPIITRLDTIEQSQTNLGPRIRSAFGNPAANTVLISGPSSELTFDTMDDLIINEVGANRVVRTNDLGLEGIEIVTPAVATCWDVVIGGLGGLVDTGKAIDEWENKITASVPGDISSNVYTYDWPTTSAKNRTSCRTVSVSASTSINVPALLAPTYNPEIAAANRINRLTLIITNSSGGNVTISPAGAATGRMPLTWQSGTSDQVVAAGATISVFVYIRGNAGIMSVGK